jgi:hypothetical protein
LEGSPTDPAISLLQSPPRQPYAHSYCAVLTRLGRGDFSRDARAAVRRAVDVQATVEGFDAGLKAAQA